MNFPNLPDGINKIILVLSVVLIYFSTTSIINNYTSVDVHYKDYLNALDSNKRAEVELDFVVNNMLEQSRNVATKYNVDNYIIDHDSLIRFTQKYNAGKNEDIARDILAPVWNSYLNKSNEVKLIRITVDRRSKEYDRKQEEVSVINSGLLILIIIAIVAFIICADQIERERKTKLKNENYIAREKGEISPWCQSCGRRFNSIITSGTNKDKTQNYSFCIDCYVDGTFTKDDDIAYEEVLESAKSTEINSPYMNRKIILKRIKNLDRWKKDNY